MRIFILSVLMVLGLSACEAGETMAQGEQAPIMQALSKDVPVVGKGRMITIQTPKGEFEVWTKKIGNNPTMKVLLLHGGPAMTHEIYEVFGKHFPEAGIEFYYYDQLGSYFSDQPNEPELWKTERFVEEVEQVRIALGLDSDNFYLFGQSWGGLLAIEYALKYQDNLKGLVIANMVSSIAEYNAYATREFFNKMDPKVLKRLKAFEAAGDYGNSEYLALLVEHHYEYHILRMPAAEWPDEINRAFAHLNPDIYVPMQGPSELGASGALIAWDRQMDLKNIHVPTLVIGATFDTMDPKHMEWMSTQVQNGRFLLCPNGSHLSQYDDEDIFFAGLIKFIKDVDAHQF
ncbi:MAG: proline iminopeptidase [Robiginitomaculum sp.]|nr:MAG: proline iminopeptidase [Robiginitomaculum sp.]